jgi:CofD-related protein of GAK system
MNSIHVTRSVQIPDRIRLSRYQKAPELGPRVLFFSGGTSLKEVSQVLKKYTHNSIHMVTPFDSGGSSAILRKAFGMPSIGDLRSRMMALADESVTGHPYIYQLFTYRFPKNRTNRQLKQLLDALIEGEDPLVSAISNPMRRLIRNQLGFFREAMPERFDLRGASIGNLILAGGYLNNHQHLDPIIFLFSKLVGVHGTVRAVVNDDLHLVADLEDGRRILGQHRMTGKEVEPLRSSIKALYLSESLGKVVPAESLLRKKNRKLIRKAELICFPPGSFYSSVIANLLPKGVGSAIANNDCPKVYIPNLGADPEQVGLSGDDAVHALLKYLRADAGEDTPDGRLLNFVIKDSGRKSYTSPVSEKLMEKMGFQVISTRLISKQSAPYYDPGLLVETLLSLT